MTYHTLPEPSEQAASWLAVASMLERRATRAAFFGDARRAGRCRAHAETIRHEIAEDRP